MISVLSSLPDWVGASAAFFVLFGVLIWGVWYSRQP